MLSDEPEDPQTVTFSLTFITDRDGFFRRTCPRCGRDYKTETDPADIVTSLQPAFHRMDLEVGPAASDDETPEGPQSLVCPYCEATAEASDTLTSVFQAYIERYAMREFVLPKVANMFRDFSDSFGSHRRSGGLLSVEVDFTYSKGVLPPRPISGPEPPDMKIVELLCCGKRVKIADNWSGLSRCPYCAAEVTLR